MIFFNEELFVCVSTRTYFISSYTGLAYFFRLRNIINMKMKILEQMDYAVPYPVFYIEE